MNLQIEKPNGQRRALTVAARVFEGKLITNLQTGMASDRMDLVREDENLARLYRHRYYELDDVMIWKMPQFDLPEPQVNDLIDKAKKPEKSAGVDEMTALRTHSERVSNRLMSMLTQ